MLKNLKKVAAIVLSFAMAVQFGLADSYYVNAVEEPVEPQQQEETTTTAPQEQEEVPTTEEETPQQQEEGQQQPAVEEEQPATEEAQPQPVKQAKVNVSYVKEDNTDLMESVTDTYVVGYRLDQDTNVFKEAHEAFEFEYAFVNGNKENKITKDQVKASGLTVTSDMTSLTLVYKSTATQKDSKDKKVEKANLSGEKEDDSDSEDEVAIAPKRKATTYNLYHYALIPGKAMDSAESADNRWFGIGVTSISGVRDPSSLEYGIQSNFTYKQEGVVRTLYPNITYNGKTYMYAATGTENADKEGYYTLIPARVNIADGANAGNNGYNPTASGKTYHQDYTMVMNENNIYTITYNVMDPGETTYGVLNDYSQRVDAGTSENKLKQPTSRDVPDVKIDSAGNKYKFDGWYKDSDCTVKAYFNGKVNANTNYYGKYVTETYTVKYDSNGGSDVLDKTLKYNDVVDISQTPTKEGYIFDGWYYGDTKVTNQKYADLAKDESKKEITLVAHWKENLKASADNVVKEYDGNAYGITVNTNVKDATIKYWNKNKGKYDLTESPTKTNVTRDTDGNITSLTVKYEVSKEGYTTVYGEATVTITPRQVKLTSEGGTKPYDGTPLTRPDVKVEGNFVDGEVTKVEATGSVTYVSDGEATNTIVITEGENFKESNYSITKNEGKLSITLVTNEVTVRVKGNKATATYDGKPHSVNGYEITDISNKLYTKDDVKFTGQAKAEGTEAGTYQMNLKKDQFSNISQNFTNVEFVVEDGSLTINPKSITPDGPNTPEDEKTGITVTAPEGSKYDGEEHKNKPTITDTKTDKVLVEGTDYELSYSEDVVNAGTVTVTVTGIGNYTGEFTKTYQILPREYTVTTDSANKTYDGTVLTAGGHVNGLVEGETVSFKTTGSQINEGTSDNTYELKFEGTAVETNYKHGKDSIGKLKVTKKSIVPDGPDTPDEKKTGITVSEPSDSKYDGKEHKEVLTVTDTKTGKELVAGTDYSVTYSSDLVNAGTVTIKVAGLGNYTGEFTKTYQILPREYTVTTDSANKTYDGTVLTAGGHVNGLVEGETVSFKTTGSQINEGTSDNTYELKFEGTAVETNYKHGKDSIGKLKVTKKSIVPDGPDTPDEKKTGITVSEPSDSKYDGKEHKEVLTVTDTKTGKELVAGTDYSVTYSSDLVNAGTVTIKVAGLGNYTGSFEKTYKITKRSVTLTSATVSKVYDGSALTNTSITVSGDGFVEGEGASYEVTGTQTEVGNSANAFEYKLNEKTLASNYNITKVVGTLTITAAPAPVTPATPSTPSTPSSTTSTTPRTLSAPQVTTPVETVEKETTPKAEPKKEEKVEEEYTSKASPQYYWALINLICAILTVLFGLLLLISKRHKSEDDDEEDDETKQQTTNDDEEKEQEKKRGLFTRVLAVLIAIVSVVFFLVTEDLSLPWTWTDQWTIWMVVIGLVQIVVFFVGRKWKNVDNDDEDEEAQQA